MPLPDIKESVFEAREHYLDTVTNNVMTMFKEVGLLSHIGYDKAWEKVRDMLGDLL